MIYCTNCGKQLNDSAKFCPVCGADLSLQSKQSVKSGKVSNNRKSLLKTPVFWIILFVVAALSILLFGKISKTDSGNNTDTNNSTSVSNVAIDNDELSIISSPNSNLPNTENAHESSNLGFTGSTFTGSDSVEILADYTYYYSIGSIEHIIVLKNISDKVIDVESESLAYDGGGKLLGVVSSDSGNGIDALSPGEVSMVHEYGSDIKSDNVGYYETKIMTPDSKYNPIIENLSYSSAEVENGYVFSVTNNGINAAKYVVGYALFFNNGELVEFDRPYFQDDDYELKPGDTLHEQSTCQKDFDSVEFYLTGRQK